MSGLRSVPSALPGGGVGGREAGAALCPRCFLQRTARCTLAHRSHPASRPHSPFLSFFPTHLLFPQRWGAEIVLSEAMVIRKRLFLQVCPPNPQIT